MLLLVVGMLIALPAYTAWLSAPPAVKRLLTKIRPGGAGTAKSSDVTADGSLKSSSPAVSAVPSATAVGSPPSPRLAVAPIDVPTLPAAAAAGSVLLLTFAENNIPYDPLFHDALWLAKISTAMFSAWIAYSLQQAGLDANPDRRNGKIKCPWPFVLAAVPWTPLGMRSLKTGLRDWQTWVVVSLVLLRI